MNRLACLTLQLRFVAADEIYVNTFVAKRIKKCDSTFFTLTNRPESNNANKKYPTLSIFHEWDTLYSTIC